MNNFVFVKKSNTYRKTLYFMLISVIIYQTILLCLNFALINKNTNFYLTLFNVLFLCLFMFITYRHILPKFMYKVEKADYKWFKIINNMLIVKFNDNKIRDYSLNNEYNRNVTNLKFQAVIKETINSNAGPSYNVTICLSDGRKLNAVLPINRVKEFINSINNPNLVKNISEEINKDYEILKDVKTKKVKNIPSYVCFGIAILSLIYVLIIVFNYSTTSGTYYATNIMNYKHNMPVNSYYYMVKDVNYSNREDYTISFGQNANKDIKVFYNKKNPKDSYTMYTIDFLMFIGLTMIIIGGILLNTKVSPYLAVLGVGIMPFYLLRLLNFTFADLFGSQIAIPFLSLMIIPIYLLISAILKVCTDIIKNRTENNLKYL